MKSFLAEAQGKQKQEAVGKFLLRHEKYDVNAMLNIRFLESFSKPKRNQNSE
jgi:hypothetical protein